MKTFIADYSNRSSAVRRAKQLNLANPVYQENDAGRVELFNQEPQTKRGPVETFRRIFAENFGQKTWSEIIAVARAAGVNQNTAKTYYYKLKVEAEA